MDPACRAKPLVPTWSQKSFAISDEATRIDFRILDSKAVNGTHLLQCCSFFGRYLSILIGTAFVLGDGRNQLNRNFISNSESSTNVLLVSVSKATAWLSARQSC